MNNKEAVILAGKGGGGGGEVTPASIVFATGQMSPEQKSQTRANLGATDALTSIPDDVKAALLAVVGHIGAWSDGRGDAYYAQLEAALYCGPLVSIEAEFTQGGTIYNNDSLDVLRQYLNVTATYTIAGDVEVTAYDLSGTLTAGTSTITVSYGDQTDTFEVTVTDFMMNDVLTLDGILNTRNGHDASSTKWEDLSGNNHDFEIVSGATPAWNADNLAFNATDKRFLATADLQGSSNKWTIELVAQNTGDGSYDGSNHYEGMIFGNTFANASGKFKLIEYTSSNGSGFTANYNSTTCGYVGPVTGISYVVYVFDGTNVKRYLDGQLVNTNTNAYQSGTKGSDWAIGGQPSGTAAYYNGKIFRIGVSSTAMSAEDIAARYAVYADRFGIGG